MAEQHWRGKAACQAVAVQVMREASLAPLELSYALLSTQTPQMQWHISGKETVNHFFPTLSYKLWQSDPWEFRLLLQLSWKD